MERAKNLCVILVAWLCQYATASNPFTLYPMKELGQTYKIAVNNLYTESATICPFNDTNPILGLCISGTITKNDDDYLVRVILKDKDKHEHCVLESYDMINDASSFSFTEYCEETALLDDIQPDSLIIAVHHATVKLNNVILAYSSGRGTIQNDMFSVIKKSIKSSQVDDIVNRINTYNKAHRKLWGACATPLAQKSFEQKKKYFGLRNDESSGGFEYYFSGIFEAGTSSRAQSTMSSSCVTQFDWCNRHGRSWITGIRHQGLSSFCFAFTAVAAIESMLMLYYNSNDSVILSSDMAARCTYSDPYYTYHNGGLASDVLQYAKDYGICDNDIAPFVDTDTIPCRSNIIIPNELVKITDYQCFSSNSEDYVKGNLIDYGPLTSGYIGHAMLLVGYGVIQIGDVIRINYGINSTSTNYVIQPSDTNYIGKTYWKFKNSYGYNPYTTVDGYSYILFNDLSYMRGPCAVIQPYRTINTSSNKVICEDKDGDGYYFWGLADKPSYCPSWVPDIPDGDDSSSASGKMLQSPKGELEVLYPGGNPPLLISGNTTYTTREEKYTHIVITPNSKLTVKNILNLFGRVNIYIASGGQLIIDGGVVTNAEIIMSSGSQLTIENDGILVKRTNTSLEAPLGAIVDVQHGKILKSNDF